jgi:hypothetical protein
VVHSYRIRALAAPAVGAVPTPSVGVVAAPSVGAAGGSSVAAATVPSVGSSSGGVQPQLPVLEYRYDENTAHKKGALKLFYDEYKEVSSVYDVAKVKDGTFFFTEKGGQVAKLAYRCDTALEWLAVIKNQIDPDIMFTDDRIKTLLAVKVAESDLSQPVESFEIKLVKMNAIWFSLQTDRGVALALEACNKQAGENKPLQQALFKVFFETLPSHLKLVWMEEFDNRGDKKDIHDSRTVF